MLADFFPPPRTSQSHGALCIYAAHPDRGLPACDLFLPVADAPAVSIPAQPIPPRRPGLGTGVSIGRVPAWRYEATAYCISASVSSNHRPCSG